MPVDFLYPMRLLLLLLLGLVVWSHYRSKLRSSRARRIGVLILRTLLVSLLVFAIAGMRWVKKSDDLCVMFVLDNSLSMQKKKTDGGQSSIEWLRKQIDGTRDYMKERDTAGLVVFGRDAALERAPASKEVFSASKSVAEVRSDLTDVAKALRLAMASFPEGSLKRLILISDGAENLGTALQEAAVASANGVTIDTCYIKPDPNRSEILIEKIHAPDNILRANDSKFKIDIVYVATEDTDAGVLVQRDDGKEAKANVKLKKGRHLLEFWEDLDQTDASPDKQYTYRVSIFPLRSQDDIEPENNFAFTTVRVLDAKQKILIVADNTSEDHFLADVLKRSGKNVELRPAAGLPQTADELMKYDVVALSNVAATKMQFTQEELLEDYVESMGKSLVMIGGTESFGPGGYISSPVEKALPLDMAVKKKVSDASLALAVLVDKSTSMLTDNRIGLCKEAAIATLKTLGSQDYLCVISFDAQPFIVQPMELVKDRKTIEERIRSIVAAGGTSIYPPMKMGVDELLRVDARLKHVILITDGHSPGGDFEGLLEIMGRERISLSTIGIGNEIDRNFLEYLAAPERGGGHFYQVTTPQSLPRILTKDAVAKMKNYIIEEPFHAQPVTINSPGVSGIDWGQAPLLYGYVNTTLKDEAELLLQTHKGEPLFAKWRYGLGKSAAFTSDAKTIWAVEWVKWPGFEKMWTEIMTWLTPDQESGQSKVSFEIKNGKGRMTVDYLDNNGNFANLKDLNATVVGPDRNAAKTRLKQIGPGRYLGEFDLNGFGAYWARVDDISKDNPKHLATVSAAVPYSPEFDNLAEGKDLMTNLSNLTGGKKLDLLLDVFKHDQEPVKKYVDIWKILLVTCLFLLLLEVAVRRLSLANIFGESKPATTPAAKQARAATYELPDKLTAPADAAVPAELERLSQLESSAPPPPDAAPKEDEPDPNTYTGRLLRAKKRSLQKPDDKKKK